MALLDEANEKLGQLALLLGNAVRQRDLELLREIVREMAISFADLDAKWAFRTMQRDLETEEQAWLSGAIAQIQRGQ